MSPVPAVNAPITTTVARKTLLPTANESWQKQLVNAIRTPAELLSRLGIQPAAVEAVPDTGFPLLVPEDFLSRMERGNRRDPLLLQVLPVTEESVTHNDFVADPVGDLSARKTPGLLQKYHGRALMIATGTCAVHCRYCFRREYPYQNEPRTLDDWQPAIESIAADDSITEVILSGGDPLMLTDIRLSDLCQAIDQIPHVERIRFHTRLPVVLPARVTTAFLDLLRSLRCQCIVVVHANHGNEIIGDCETALRRIVSSGSPVLNQSVLLKHVNDSANVLETLSRRLINLGVMPYYLHQLDRVNGAAHFEVEPETGTQLIEQLRKRLPGYAVPKFVQEVAGAEGKTPIN